MDEPAISIPDPSCDIVSSSGAANPPAPAQSSIQIPVRPSIQIIDKHPRAIRWMHWINFPVLAVMIWSGLMIYWADSDYTYDYSHRVYRLGLGSWTLIRLFPDSFYKKLGLDFHLASGLGFHFFFMWIFAVNGVLYVAFLLISGEWREIVPNRATLRNASHVVLHDLGIVKTPPPIGKFNGAQQIAYTGVVLMGIGALITGFAIWKPTQLWPLTRLLGGYEMARWEHFWLMIGFVAFFLVHVAQVVRAGWNNFRSMVSGQELVQVENTSSAPETEVAHGD